MTRIRETGRYPGLYLKLTVIASLVLAIPTLYLVFLLWKLFFCPQPNFLELGLTIGILGTIGTVVVTYLIAKILIFTINHLSGRPVIEDVPLRSNSICAYSYYITTAYTLPFAYNGRDRDGDHYCDLYLSLSYAEIYDLYQYLRRRHRIFAYLNALSLPSHLGKRTPILTRKTAKQLLYTMNAISENVPVIEQRVVLQYSFYPSYSGNINLPEHEVFLSRRIISELLFSFPAENGQIPANAEITVSINAAESVRLSARYLQECYGRISTDDEFIYIPLL